MLCFKLGEIGSFRKQLLTCSLYLFVHNQIELWWPFDLTLWRITAWSCISPLFVILLYRYALVHIGVFLYEFVSLGAKEWRRIDATRTNSKSNARFCLSVWVNGLFFSATLMPKCVFQLNPHHLLCVCACVFVFCFACTCGGICMSLRRVFILYSQPEGLKMTCLLWLYPG